MARRTINKVIAMLKNDEELMKMSNVWYAVKRRIKESINDVRVRLKLYMELDNDEKFNELAKRGDIEEALEYVMKKIEERERG
ncbi:MAG: hypothetical protein TU36_006135 [Vulcanisaeta sp. AZ3]